MLTEQRYEMILNLLEENKSVTVTQIKELLHISESTARRDITALHQAGKLIKVFGGAVALEGEVISREPTVQQKENVNKEQKIRIAKYAASLIEPDDFVFIDAGTTTAYMIYYTEKCHVCDQCSITCEKTCRGGIPCVFNRRRVKGQYGGTDWNGSSRSITAVSFCQRFFRCKRYHLKMRLYDTGYS